MKDARNQVFNVGNDEIPETSEKKTKGTIRSFNRLTNIELPKLNI